MSPKLPQKQPPKPPQDPQITLAWEAANRKRAAICAWVAAGLTIVGSLLASMGTSSVPTFNNSVVTGPAAMNDLLAGQPIPPGRTAMQVLWFQDHLSAVNYVGTVLAGIAALLLFGVIVFLFKATRARNPGFGQATLIAGAFGAVAFGVGTMVAQLSSFIGISGFSGGNNLQASEALTGGPVYAGQILLTLGSFGLGFAFVMIGLNAMRVGLLTRFMGILAMIVGATFIIPQVDPQGVLRSFWLAVVAFVFILRWPGNKIPPAWLSGKAEPWPSLAAGRAEKSDASGPDSAPEPAPAPSLPQSSSNGDAADDLRKKRKRKK